MYTSDLTPTFLHSSTFSTGHDILYNNLRRLTKVTEVTILLDFSDNEALGFLPDHLVIQEQAGVDISAYKNSKSRAIKYNAALAAQIALVEAVTLHLPHLQSLIIELGGSMASFSPWTRLQMVSDYLLNKLGGLHLRNICARICEDSTYHYWSCLDDTAVDFMKRTMGAWVLNVFITSLPGRHLPSAIFANFSMGCTFNTNMKIAGLEGYVLEKCVELRLLCEEKVEEEEIRAVDNILHKMPTLGWGLNEVTMPKVSQSFAHFNFINLSLF